MKPADQKQFDEFFNSMIKALEEHTPLYGDSWKEMSVGKLFDRLQFKFKEFDLTYDKKKLISLANLTMLLYIRMKGDEAKDRYSLM